MWEEGGSRGWKEKSRCSLGGRGHGGVMRETSLAKWQQSEKQHPHRIAGRVRFTTRGSEPLCSTPRSRALIPQKVARMFLKSSPEKWWTFPRFVFHVCLFLIVTEDLKCGGKNTKRQRTRWLNSLDRNIKYLNCFTDILSCKTWQRNSNLITAQELATRSSYVTKVTK